MTIFALASDFPPVFHIKLKDQVLLEGEAATLLCLPAACPAPHIVPDPSDQKALLPTVPPDLNLLSPLATPKRKLFFGAVFAGITFIEMVMMLKIRRDMPFCFSNTPQGLGILLLLRSVQ